MEFNEATHRYSVTDKGKTFRSPSVTGVLGVLDKPALVQWAANMTIEYMKAQLTDGTNWTTEQLAVLCDEARFNFRKVSREAADVGTQAHNRIEAFMQGLEPAPVADERVMNCYGAALDWMNQHSVKPLHIERPLYSRKHKVAGKADQISMVDGELAVVDWKSSKGIYPEHRFQTAAYAAMYAEETGEMPAVRWLIQLGKETGEFNAHRMTEQKKDWKAFLGALAVRNRLTELKSGTRN